MTTPKLVVLFLTISSIYSCWLRCVGVSLWVCGVRNLSLYWCEINTQSNREKRLWMGAGRFKRKSKLYLNCMLTSTAHKKIVPPQVKCAQVSNFEPNSKWLIVPIGRWEIGFLDILRSVCQCGILHLGNLKWICRVHSHSLCLCFSLTGW